jgi:hypothetical protein
MPIYLIVDNSGTTRPSTNNQDTPSSQTDMTMSA